MNSIYQDLIPMIKPFIPIGRVQILATLSDYNLKLMNIPEMWKKTRGSEVKIAVLDTGVAKHNDLTPVGTHTFVDVSSIDKLGHGTHVAGLVAGIGFNDMGVLGIAPDVDDYYIKVLNDEGSGTVDGIIKGIYYAVDVLGVNVINMSLGIHIKEKLDNLEEVCNYADSKNVIICAAAGNESGFVSQPACYDSVLAISSVNELKELSKFSNFGEQVDYCADGEKLYSTYLDNGYCTMSGTCIAKGTYIYTPNGPKKIENIKINDEIYAYKDGQIVVRKVVNNIYQGKNKVYHLRGSGRDVWATETHKFLVFNTELKNNEWIELKNLEEKHKLIIPIGFDCKLNQYLDDLITEEFAWLLGFFLGDGWLSVTGGKKINRDGVRINGEGVRINFANGIDNQLIEKVKNIYEKYVGKPLKDNLQGSWCYDDSTLIASVIDTLGLNAYAKNKTIPNWLWNVSFLKRMAFYRGYLESDGHDCKFTDIYRNPRKKFECSSYDLIRRLAILADYNGWQHSTVTTRERMIQAPSQLTPKLSISHCLTIGEGRPLNGLACLDTTTSVNKIKRNIKGIEIAEKYGLDAKKFMLSSWFIDKNAIESDVYDLTVPDADSFIAHGLIVHNSMASPIIAGVISLILSDAKINSGKELSKAELIQKLNKICFDLGPQGFDPSFGNGIPLFK